ncbi:MAG: hypothetical protein WCK05_07850 [Planctomycetota bacterium]
MKKQPFVGIARIPKMLARSRSFGKLSFSAAGQSRFLLLFALCVLLGCEPKAVKEASVSLREDDATQIQTVQRPLGPEGSVAVPGTLPAEKAPIIETKSGTTVTAAGTPGSGSGQAEAALRKATDRKEQAKAAADAAKQAASDAKRCAAAGNAPAARAAALEAAEAAWRAGEAAEATATHAQQTVDAARTMENRGTAADLSRQAEVAQRASGHYARSAAQDAATAKAAADAARRADSAKASAEAARGEAQKAVSAQDGAESHAEKARKAAATGNPKEAGAAAEAARRAAEDAADCAKEASGHALEIKGSIAAGDSPSAGIADQAATIREALAEGVKAAQQAEAASTGAAKAAANAQQHAAEAQKPAFDSAEEPSPVLADKKVEEPAAEAQGTPAGQVAGRPQGGVFDIGAVPLVPELVTPRPRPTGIIEAETPVTTRPTRILGAWSQVDGDQDADFVLGGYASSTIVFRVDGILEVRRVFGTESPISMVWRMSCDWSQDGRTLTLGKEENAKTLAASLKGFAISGSGIRSTDAAQSLPLTTTVTRLANGDIRFNGKTYRSNE